MAAGIAPAPAGAANSAEVFRAARQAWKESPEAKLAFKLTRKVAIKSFTRARSTRLGREACRGGAFASLGYLV